MIRALGAVLLMEALQDASPAGKWKWSVERNGETFETKLELKLDGEKVTGTTTGRDGKETPITEASFKDGEVKVQATRELNGVHDYKRPPRCEFILEDDRIRVAEGFVALQIGRGNN